MKSLIPINDENVNRFYEQLRKKIKNQLSKFAGKYGEEGAKILLAAPDLIVLLWRLIKDERVPVEKKVFLVSVIAYWIIPVDLLPEAILGVIGYADDIFITLYVLNDLINNVGEDVIRDNWPGDEDVIKFIKESLKIAEMWMEKSGKSVKEKLDLLVKSLLESGKK